MLPDVIISMGINVMGKDRLEMDFILHFKLQRRFITYSGFLKEYLCF